MPSSHLRMEEATSIIASKSISDGFGRPEIDDLEDFVLQIDENEINNEIKANGLVEDVAIEVFNKMENNEEKTIKPLKTLIETEELMNCGTNHEPEERTIQKSSELEDKEQEQIISKNINGLCEKKNADMEEETDCQNDSEANLKCDTIVSTDSDKTVAPESNTTNEKTVEVCNGVVNIKEEVDQRSLNDVTEGSSELNLNESVPTTLVDMKEETTEFIGENLESVDKELDSLLSMEPDISREQPNSVSEPMDVDPPPNDLSVIKMTTIEHPASIALELQNQVEKMDSDSDCSNDPNLAPDSPPSIIMHSPRTVTELDGNSSISDGFLKEKTIKRFSKINKAEGETDKETKEEFIYHTVKHIQISAQSNVFKESHNSEKRLKREADEETNNDQKKIKLESDKNVTEEPKIKNNLDNENLLNPAKKLKKDSDTQSESSCDSGSSTGSDSGSDNDSDSSDEAVDTNGADTINAMKKLNKLVPEEISPETLKEIMEGRQKLFANYFEGKTDITINRYVLEEMVMTQMIEMITYRSDVGQLRQKCRVLENEQIRMNQKVYALKKQAENARLIIKKLIDEKSNNKNWTQTAIPLKVTRSVGLQVCTCGSMTVRSPKFLDKDSNPPRNEKVVNKDSANATCNSGSNGDSDANKVGSFDNKENISSNIEKDVPNNKDSNSTDDVVIVSVTENNSTAPSNTIDKSVNVSSKKILETPKNGILPTEKVVRKPLGTEYTNSPTVNKKTSITPNSKKVATDDSLTEKESSQPNKIAAPEIIDLTDKEDNPVKKSEESSKSVSASVSSEKHTTTGIVEKSRKTISSQPNPLVAVNGIKKPPGPTSTPIRKSLDIAPAADLVNSYDHLPKYPASPKYPPNVSKPPRPILRIGKNTSGKQGIMLSWSFEGGRNPQNIEEYQLYAYQESKNSEKLKTDTWKKVGDIKALPLPMACFLTQFVEGHKYHFIVRAVDTQKKLGDFSLPGSIILHAAGQPPSAS